MNPQPEMEIQALPPPPPEYAARMPYVPEAVELVNVGPDHFGRDAFLTPMAAQAWHAMQHAARSENIELLLISAFRSVERQTALVAAKLARGMSLDEALEYSAYPGFSEHHSGRAIDIGSPESSHLDESFDQTAAFAWLYRKAADFDFTLSYPVGNRFGIAYEPWHWCFGGSARE